MFCRNCGAENTDGAKFCENAANLWMQKTLRT